MNLLSGLLSAFGETARDVLPIAAVLVGFQVLVLRRSIPHPGRILGGFFFVVIGLSLFLQGLEQALFPLGQLMALQLTDTEFLLQTASGALDAVRWQDYYWVYAFAFCIGFATTIAEPALIAVAMKAEDVSAGAIGSIGLRVAVALGVAVGIALGAWRIVTGHPLEYFIMAGYVVVIIQTIFAPRIIIALAYDSGGVTTSTVTVPLVAALGLGLAENVPGRSPLIDGFGLIAFASLFPIMSVLAYAQIVEWRSRRKRRDEESQP